MDILKAAISECKAKIDKQGYLMNISYQFADKNNLQDFLDSVREYNLASADLKTIESFASQATSNNNNNNENQDNSTDN
mgnify:FL=1